MIFAQVLLTCDRQGLIGRQMFAIHGVKLPSNADKRRSGTHAELAHEAGRMEAAVAKMLKAHCGRDERFAAQGRYKALPDPLSDKAAASKPSKYSTACSTHGRKHHQFQGAKRDCAPCHLRDQCLRYPERTQARQVAFFDKSSPLRYTERMKRAIDSARGRKLYGRRIAIVEPVFANLRHNKRLDRFTLRTQPKVNTQWNLYCLVRNIGKLAHHGYGM